MTNIKDLGVVSAEVVLAQQVGQLSLQLARTIAKLADAERSFEIEKERADSAEKMLKAGQTVSEAPPPSPPNESIKP